MNSFCSVVCGCMWMLISFSCVHVNVCISSTEGESSWSGRKEMFYLTTHSAHFIYGYMTSDLW